MALGRGTMQLSERIERLIPDLGTIIARFPVPVGFSILLSLYINAQILNGHTGFDDDMVWGGSAGFLASGAAHLFAEARGMARTRSAVIALACGLLATAFALITGVFQTSLLMLFCGLVLMLMVAAYLRPHIAQGALWLFNLRLGLAALLATIVGVLFAAGLSAIVEALKFLFDVPLPNNLHEHIWSIAAFLIGPLYGLSLVPRDTNEEVNLAAQKNTLLEKGVSVLVNYVLVPVIVIYALILHAYAIKIALQWELPKGQIGTMVTIFALGGTGAWLVAWPWRDSGTRLLRLFMTGWFWLTITPAALLVIAISRRVSDYGITPDRYGLILVAVWLALLSLYLAVQRNRADMRAVLGGLAVLLLAGSLGPWGANGSTITSQLGRLTAFAQSHGLLSDGKLVLPPARLAAEAQSDGYSMIDALREAGGLDRLRPWFAGRDKDPFKSDQTGWGLASAISEQLGFAAYAPPPNFVNFSATIAASHTLPAASRIIGPVQISTGAPVQTTSGLVAEIKNDALNISANGKSWVLPVEKLLAQAREGSVVPGQPQPPVLIDGGSGLSLLVDNLSGQTGDTVQLHYARVWIILRP